MEMNSGRYDGDGLGTKNGMGLNGGTLLDMMILEFSLGTKE